MADPRFYFVLCFGMMLAGSLWMLALGKKFRHRKYGGEMVPFNIFDLQFPSTEAEMGSLVRDLEAPARRALKTHLWVDFIYMLGLYPAIALLCIIVGDKTGAGSYFFWLVEALQGVAWVADIYENVYCLKKMRRPEAVGAFKTYTFFVNTKFVLAFLGLAVSLPVAFYFWMTGEFWLSSAGYAGIVAAEVFIFLLIIGYNISRSGSSSP